MMPLTCCTTSWTSHQIKFASLAVILPEVRIFAPPKRILCYLKCSAYPTWAVYPLQTPMRHETALSAFAPRETFRNWGWQICQKSKYQTIILLKKGQLKSSFIKSNTLHCFWQWNHALKFSLRICLKAAMNSSLYNLYSSGVSTFLCPGVENSYRYFYSSGTGISTGFLCFVNSYQFDEDFWLH